MIRASKGRLARLRPPASRSRPAAMLAAMLGTLLDALPAAATTAQIAELKRLPELERPLEAVADPHLCPEGLIKMHTVTRKCANSNILISMLRGLSSSARVGTFFLQQRLLGSVWR